LPASPPPTLPSDPTTTVNDIVTTPVNGAMAVFDLYMLGWDNFGSAWSILKNHNTSFLHKYLAYAYMINWGGAHVMFGLGVAGLGCAATSPGCVAAVEGFLGIGGVISADGDPTNEIQIINTGINSVYRYVEYGVPRYYGITNNFLRRAGEHMAERGWQIQQIPGLSSLSRFDARAVEQVLIEQAGLVNLNNQIYSISPSNPIYSVSYQRGIDILRAVSFLP
jgi:hypothetical protein